MSQIFIIFWCSNNLNVHSIQFLAGVITALEGSKVKLLLKINNCMCDQTIYFVYSNGYSNHSVLKSAGDIDGFDICNDSCITDGCDDKQCDISLANAPVSNIYFSTMCSIPGMCQRRMDISIIVCESNFHYTAKKKYGLLPTPGGGIPVHHYCMLKIDGTVNENKQASTLHTYACNSTKL